MRITRHVLWIALASVGCASPVKALREDNRRLQQNVAELRADRRVQDRRIRDLEHQLAEAKVSGPTSDAVPVLPVEVVAPPAHATHGLVEGQRFVGIADDGSEIIYEGDAALGKPAMPSSSSRPRSAPPSRAKVDHNTTHVSARTPKVVTRSDGSDPAASDAYRVAVDLVKAGKTQESVAALRGFLQKYPRHEYADNAQYWLGEAFYAAKEYQHALVEFRATIETYPRGNKVPDALLKVGYCYHALGQAEKARAVLEQVVNLYPKSEPAALAARRLESP